MLQILIFILVVFVILLVVGFVILGVIGANLMRLVLWFKRLFSHNEPPEDPEPETRGQKPQGSQVIGDDEGEYVDFEEVK